MQVLNTFCVLINLINLIDALGPDFATDHIL